MVKLTAVFLACITFLMDTASDYGKDIAWMNMTEEQRYECSYEIKARACGMTAEEFDLLSRTVEAESDRSANIEGRIMIALTILNRVESGSFPGTITGVITQDGQFQVYEDGVIWSVGRTELSDWAIVEAHRWQATGEAPLVLWFNNQGYCHTPYDYIGGNYFSL